MDEKQLDTFLKSKPSKSAVYLGVVASDEQPRVILDKLKKNVFWVTNTSSRATGGTHWTSMFIDVSRRSIEWFNSLGLMPKDDLLKFLQNLESQNDALPVKKRFQFKLSRTIIQGIYLKKGDKVKPDNLCGLYSIVFLVRRLSGDKFADASGYTSHADKLKTLVEFGAKLNIPV